MGVKKRRTAKRASGYATSRNPKDPDEHRHGSVVHSHPHTGPHRHSTVRRTRKR